MGAEPVASAELDRRVRAAGRRDQGEGAGLPVIPANNLPPAPPRPAIRSPAPVENDELGELPEDDDAIEAEIAALERRLVAFPLAASSQALLDGELARAGDAAARRDVLARWVGQVQGAVERARMLAAHRPSRSTPEQPARQHYIRILPKRRQW
jgi:hypothetical protein